VRYGADFMTVFQEDGLDGEQAWSSRRDMEVDEINARELLGKGVRIKEFRPGAERILAWSDDQDPSFGHAGINCSYSSIHTFNY
jgi:hypothetical protein